MTNGEREQLDEVSSGQLTPGVLLQQQRVTLGLSREQVANQLHLRVRIIELIEADNYAQMPELVFIRGYLRAYANFVHLSGDELIDLFNQVHAADLSSERADVTLWQNVQPHKTKFKWIRGLTALVFFAGLILTALWWHNPAQVLSSQTYGNDRVKSSGGDELSLPNIERLSPVMKLAVKSSFEDG